MHSIHTTPGFIIDSRPYGEAGKIMSLFTRDFGLVPAIAQGIRLEKSKLRYFSQDYSLGIFSLVRGKEFWCLTSAQGGTDGGSAPVRSEVAARISLLLKRLLQGEDPHPELFGCVESSMCFLAGNQSLTADELRTLESLVVFRILKSLGYIGEDDGLPALVDSKGLTREMLHDASAKRTALNQHINKALKESHL